MKHADPVATLAALLEWHSPTRNYSIEVWGGENNPSAVEVTLFDTVSLHLVRVEGTDRNGSPIDLIQQALEKWDGAEYTNDRWRGPQ